jgi:hypothetical protein
MSNLFDSTNYRTQEPTLKEYQHPIVAGDLLAWKRTDLGSDYPPASYALSYSARLNGVASALTLTASESGSDYIIEYASTATANFPVGIYQWAGYITKSSDSNRIQIDSGTWEVIPNRATSTVDPEPHVKTVLDAIEAVIESRASQDQMSFSIAGRSLSRMSIQDLLTFRDQYKAMWLKEKRMQRAREGLGHNGIIKTQLSRY